MNPDDPRRPAELVDFMIETQDRAGAPLHVDSFNLDVDSLHRPGSNPQNAWQIRLAAANQERRLVSKFWAGLILLFGVINAAPLMIEIYHGSGNDRWFSSSQIPRWMFLQVLLSALMVAYPLLIFQIPDWSSLRGVSLVLLLVTFVFGTLCSGLAIEAEGGIISSFLQLSLTQTNSAIIWTLAMLGLAGLLSYGLGREASQWERAEDLLREIMEQQQPKGI